VVRREDATGLIGALASSLGMEANRMGRRRPLAWGPPGRGERLDTSRPFFAANDAVVLENCGTI